MTSILCLILILCPMSYGLMALVYVLFLGLRLAIFIRFSLFVTRVDALSCVNMSFLRILTPFEEPPHLTADCTAGQIG